MKGQGQREQLRDRSIDMIWTLDLRLRCEHLTIPVGPPRDREPHWTCSHPMRHDKRGKVLKAGSVCVFARRDGDLSTCRIAQEMLCGRKDLSFRILKRQACLFQGGPPQETKGGTS